MHLLTTLYGTTCRINTEVTHVGNQAFRESPQRQNFVEMYCILLKGLTEMTTVNKAVFDRSHAKLNSAEI